MDADRENGVISDTEGTEKPVRERFEKASISKSKAEKVDMGGEELVVKDENAVEDSEEVRAAQQESNGHLQKKRSREDFEDEQIKEPPAANTRHHTRKRSRDSTAEEFELNNGSRKSGERSREDSADDDHSANGEPRAPTSAARQGTPERKSDKRSEAAVEEMTSPKTKRSRLGSEKDKEGESASARTSFETKGDKTGQATVAAGDNGDKSAGKITATSGFANASASSPFASLSGSKPPATETTKTSSSAFAASGFSSLSGSTTSGFGAIGKTSGGFGTGGGFGLGAKSPAGAEGAKSPPTSTFGGALGQQSAFGASGSGGGFGSGSSGFGSALGQGSAFGGSGFSSVGGGGLASFASGKPSSALGGSSKSAKPFGAAADDEADGDDNEEAEDESGFKSPLSQESDKQDERFYQQELETGEEDEETIYTVQAKLYNFVSVDGKKEWKERGVGITRLNVKQSKQDHDAKPSARLLMRANGSHRVILNTPVKKGLKFGGPTGEKPDTGQFGFLGAVEGRVGLETLTLKMRHPHAVELYEKIAELQEKM